MGRLLSSMEITIVFDGGSGSDSEVKKAFRKGNAETDFERKIQKEAGLNDLLVVYEEGNSYSVDGDLIRKDEETGHVWAFYEHGSVIEGEGRNMRVETTEGRESKGVKRFEYEEWDGDENKVVLDNGDELEGEVSRVEE